MPTSVEWVSDDRDLKGASDDTTIGQDYGVFVSKGWDSSMKL